MLTQVSATQQSQQQGLNALNEAVQNQQSAIEAQQKEMDDLQASLAAAPMARSPGRTSRPGTGDAVAPARDG
jgi:uncharacterized coiled-coil protein SlyX